MADMSDIDKQIHNAYIRSSHLTFPSNFANIKDLNGDDSGQTVELPIQINHNKRVCARYATNTHTQSSHLAFPSNFAGVEGTIGNDFEQAAELPIQINHDE